MKTSLSRYTMSCAIGCAILLLFDGSLLAQKKTVFGPAIDRLVWLCPRQIAWELASTPLWYSLGHGNRVLAILPEGVRDENGKVIKTTDGTGLVYAVTFRVYQVDQFDPDSGLPGKVRLVQERTIKADDPIEKRRTWGFPSETGYNWEMELLPKKQRQILFRTFLHDQKQLWLTLMVHGEADLAALPEALAKVANSKTYFKALLTYTLVMELLNDPEVKLTSKYIEPDDPPSTWWIENENVKAPWSVNRKNLDRVTGSFSLETNDQAAFSPLSERSRKALQSIKTRNASSKQGPKITDNVPDELEKDLQ